MSFSEKQTSIIKTLKLIDIDKCIDKTIKECTELKVLGQYSKINKFLDLVAQCKYNKLKNKIVTGDKKNITDCNKEELFKYCNENGINITIEVINEYLEIGIGKVREIKYRGLELINSSRLKPHIHYEVSKDKTEKKYNDTTLKESEISSISIDLVSIIHAMSLIPKFVQDDMILLQEDIKESVLEDKKELIKDKVKEILNETGIKELIESIRKGEYIIIGTRNTSKYPNFSPLKVSIHLARIKFTKYLVKELENNTEIKNEDKLTEKQTIILFHSLHDVGLIDFDRQLDRTEVIRLVAILTGIKISRDMSNNNIYKNWTKMYNPKDLRKTDIKKVIEKIRDLKDDRLKNNLIEKMKLAK